MINKGTILLIDMDDTIEDLLPAWISYLNDKYHYNIDYRNINQWGIPPFFPELSRDQVINALNDTKLWENVKPKTDAQEVLKELNKETSLFICTASTNMLDSISYKINNTLLKNFPYLNLDQVIITSRKQLIHGDYLIDDCEHNLLNGKYKGILFDRNSNKSFNNEKYNIPRFDNWYDIYSYLHK